MHRKVAKEEDPINGMTASNIAQSHEVNLQINKYHTRGGVGYAAEDANAARDALAGKQVEKVGLSNALNGADRISDGISIQSKYYQTAAQSIDACFDVNGKFRYPHCRIEVPADQYEEASRILAKKGFSKDFLIKGSVTYKQAANIAKAGNIDSLVFDTKNAVCFRDLGEFKNTSFYTGTISMAIAYGVARYRNKDRKDALQDALICGLACTGKDLFVRIVGAQLLRTRTIAAGVVASREAVNLVAKTTFGKQAMEAIAKASLNKSVSGAAARNHVAKLLRSNAAMAGVMLFTTTIPDFYRVLIAKNISWAQFSQNMVVNATGIGSGIAGSLAATALLAFMVSNPAGWAIAAAGLFGGVAGGIAGGSLGQAIVSKLGTDDSVKSMECLNKAIIQTATDFLLSDDEFHQLMDTLQSKVDQPLLRRIYQEIRTGDEQSGFENGVAYASEWLERPMMAIISQRPQIQLPSHQEVTEGIQDLGNTIALAQAHANRFRTINFFLNHYLIAIPMAIIITIPIAITLEYFPIAPIFGYPYSNVREGLAWIALIILAIAYTWQRRKVARIRKSAYLRIRDSFDLIGMHWLVRETLAIALLFGFLVLVIYGYSCTPMDAR